jgi:hypothetical protein
MSGAMKTVKRWGLALAVLGLLAGSALAADAVFLKEVDDLPLAPGLTEQPGGTLFDTPQGRIVEATAQGPLLEVEVRQFYDENLPQLGWAQVGPSTYRRDKEVLHIQYSEGGMPIVVHFSIAPFKSADGKDTGDKP